jgi:hypothetical protein
MQIILQNYVQMLQEDLHTSALSVPGKTPLPPLAKLTPLLG